MAFTEQLDDDTKSTDNIKKWFMNQSTYYILEEQAMIDSVAQLTNDPLQTRKDFEEGVALRRSIEGRGYANSCYYLLERRKELFANKPDYQKNYYTKLTELMPWFKERTRLDQH